MFNFFESASTAVRLGFDSASRQIPNSFMTASAGLRLAFGGKRRAPEGLANQVQTFYKSGTFQGGKLIEDFSKRLQGNFRLG